MSENKTNNNILGFVLLKDANLDWPRFRKAMTDENVGDSIKSDMWYIKNWSIWLDILTVYRSVFPKQPNKNTIQTDIA